MLLRRILIGILVLVLLAFLGWQLRGYYFMWQMKRSGFVPYRLAYMKESALPLLQRAVDRLEEPADPVRCKALALALQEVRYQIVADRIGSRYIGHVVTALEPVDTAVVDAIQRLYRLCSNEGERIEIAVAMGELDFNMKTRVFCALLDLAEGEDKSFVVSLFNSAIYVAYGEHAPDGDYFGWADLNPEQFEQKRREMRQTLEACAIPVARRALEPVKAKYSYEELPYWAFKLQDELDRHINAKQ